MCCGKAVKAAPEPPGGAGPSPCVLPAAGERRVWGRGSQMPGVKAGPAAPAGTGHVPMALLEPNSGVRAVSGGKRGLLPASPGCGTLPSRLDGWRLCRREAQGNRASGQTHTSPQLQLSVPWLLPPHGSGWLHPKARRSVPRVLSEHFKEPWVTKPSAERGFSPGRPHRPWGQVSCTPSAATIHRGRSATS